MKKFLLWTSGSFLGLLVLVLSGAAVLLGTETGLQWTLQRIERAQPGMLAVGSAHGHLLGRLHLTDVRIDIPAAAIEIADLVLDWRPRRLFGKELYVRLLSAERIRVDTVGRGSDEPDPDKAPLYPVSLPDLRLPLAIDVESLGIDDVEVRTTADSDPLQINHAALSARWDGSGIAVRHLAASMPGLAAELDGTLDPVGDYPVDLNTQVTISLEAAPKGRLQGTLSGDAAELGIRQRFTGDAELAFSAVLAEPLEALSWNGQLDIERLPGTLITADLPADFSGTFATSGDLKGARLDGQVRADSPSEPFYNLRSALAAAMDFESLSVDIDRFEVDHKTLPMRAIVAGTASVGDRSVDLEGSWNELRWPLAGEVTAGSKRGDFTLRGTLDDYTLAFDSDVFGKDIPAGQWTAYGEGDTNRLRRFRIEGETLDGKLSSNGSVAWKPSLAFDVQTRAAQINPGVQYAEWKGSIDLDAAVRGEIAEAGPDLSVLLKSLKGDLRGYPLQGEGEVDITKEVIEIARLSLGSGSARLNANGRLGEDSDLSWEVRVPDAADLLPDAKGSVTGRGHVRGPKTRPVVEATLDASALDVNRIRVASLSLTADVDVSDRKPSTVRLSGQGISAQGQEIESIALAADGRLGQHTLTGDLVHALGRLDLALKGGAKDERWSGTLDRLSLKDTELGAWNLERPVKLAAGANEASAESLCLRRESARICAEGQWRKLDADRQESGGEFSVSAFPLAWFKPWMPEDIRKVQGEVSASGDARITQKLEANVEVDVSPGKITYLHPGAGEVTLANDGLELSGKARDDAVEAKAKLALARTQMEASFRSPDLLAVEDPMEAALVAGIRLDGPDLDYVAALVPQISEIQGGVRADLDVKGTLGDPSLDGKGRITLENLKAPEYGVALRDSFLDLAGKGRSYEIDGKLASAKGELNLAGRGELDASAGWPAKVTIRGDDFHAVSLPEADVFVSPDLYIEKTPDLLRLAGEVTVPKADIFLRSLPTSARTAHEDIVVIQDQAEEAERATPTPIQVDVQLTLGREIHFVGFGLDAFFDGGLRVLANPGDPLSVAGDIRIDQGTFRAYGQDLTIERGIVSFAGGPPTNPGINLRATREIDNVVAGINAIGPIRRPRITTFSTPAMAERDVISYILTGKPTSELGQGGGGTLSVGRQINSKLSASVGTNLETGEAEFSTRYRLHRKVHVQGSTTSRSSAADIFFTHEID